jgi:2-phosphoglycerate kinase
MPIDPVASLSAIVRVRDRVGLDLPFSRGIMASSILATGLPTDQAYGIASAIQRQLDSGGPGEVSADALACLAAKAIDEMAGDSFGRRYRSWRATRRSGRPIIVVLSGAPGVGKSTVAARLAARLGISRVVTTDTIRDVLRTVIPPSVLPELHASTYELDVPPAYDGFERQAAAVASATMAVADRLTKERRNVLLEGVHLLPGLVTRSFAGHTDRPVVVERLLVLDDAGVHRAQLKKRSHDEPARRGDRTLDHLDTIRHIQDHLTGHAARNGIGSYNLADPTELTQQVVDAIVAALEQPPGDTQTTQRAAPAA